MDYLSITTARIGSCLFGGLRKFSSMALACWSVCSRHHKAEEAEAVPPRQIF
jgi:hypothetical protein